MRNNVFEKYKKELNLLANSELLLPNNIALSKKINDADKDINSQEEIIITSIVQTKNRFNNEINKREKKILEELQKKILNKEENNKALQEEVEKLKTENELKQSTSNYIEELKKQITLAKFDVLDVFTRCSKKKEEMKLKTKELLTNLENQEEILFVKQEQYNKEAIINSKIEVEKEEKEIREFEEKISCLQTNISVLDNIEGDSIKVYEEYEELFLKLYRTKLKYENKAENEENTNHKSELTNKNQLEKMNQEKLKTILKEKMLNAMNKKIALLLEEINEFSKFK